MHYRGAGYLYTGDIHENRKSSEAEMVSFGRTILTA
jgi:hypothetical protein